MTKKEYLEALDRMLGCIDDMAKDIDKPEDAINLLRLQFDIVTAGYEVSCDKKR